MVAPGFRKYSERLGVIGLGQLQQACDRFDLGTVERAEPASTGLWGQNILLSTTTGEFVLRGNPSSPEQFPKERAVAAVIKERSPLPAPWPYHISNDTEPFGWPYAVMPRLPGMPGSTFWAALDERSRVDLAAAHARALSQLHEATFDAPGPYDAARESFVATDDFCNWTLDRIAALRTQCRAIDALSAEAEHYIDVLIDSCSDALTEPFVPVLVHHDFSLANTTYRLVDDRYRATGVFDLGDAHIGDGEEDLVRFLFRRKREQREAFVDAYSNERPFRPGASERLTLFALADLLFMWDVSQRVTNWFGDASFVDVAKPVVENARMAAV